jgi:hypothetical protein
MRKLSTVMVMLALVVSLAACGSDDSGSGVDGSKSVDALDASEKGKLCDWFANQFGGYGAVDPCALTGLEVPATQAECVAAFPVCTATAGQLEGCVAKLASASKSCTEGALLTAGASADCQAALPCLEAVAAPAGS